MALRSQSPRVKASRFLAFNKTSCFSPRRLRLHAGKVGFLPVPPESEPTKGQICHKPDKPSLPWPGDCSSRP